MTVFERIMVIFVALFLLLIGAAFGPVGFVVAVALDGLGLYGAFAT